MCSETTRVAQGIRSPSAGTAGLPLVLTGWLAGLIFGVGLLVSGMSDSAKVLNFLDILGSWDPSLAFVMGGAVLVTTVGYPLLTRRGKPRLLPQFQMPVRTDIDAPLLGGAALFGLGWGIGGFCPGPAWTALASLAPGALVFLSTMLIGMWLASWWKKKQQRST